MKLGLPDWQGLQILVVGDLMLDRFIHGEVRRISPEAPIPVVDVEEEYSALGGAANVAHNLRALGAKPSLVGVIGDDIVGTQFLETLSQRGIDTSGVLRVPGRPTTVKTRIIAQHQQIVRIDRERRDQLSGEHSEAVYDAVFSRISSARALVVSDYAKGVLNPEILDRIGHRCKEGEIPYVVDPKPIHFPYPGATVVTPNRGEAAGFYGRRFSSSELFTVADFLLSKTDWGAMLVTMGEEGMALCERGKKILHIRANKREVFDVTGAGDTVVSVLGLALAAGEALPVAASLANVAAGVVVGKMGTAVCSPQEISDALRKPSQKRRPERLEKPTLRR